MTTRRQMIFRSAQLGAMLATLGFLPGAAQAQAAYNAAAFEAKNMAELMKALGASAPTESKDVTITGPDIAENGAVVPIGASTALPGAKRPERAIRGEPHPGRPARRPNQCRV